MKDFTQEFDKILFKVKENQPFAFSRFSDGELFIMQNKTVILAKDHYITGDIKGPNIYTEEEQKEFLPERDQFYRERLIECFKNKKENYFKGICTSSDPHLSNDNFQYQIELHAGDHETLTFSNLLINANYRRFIEEMVPLFSEKEIIYVVNKLANTEQLPFVLKKKFEIGSNCMIDDYKIVEEIKEYIAQQNIKGHIILCSAASLSNFIIHDCFMENDHNIFLDIGSCLNPLLGLQGWQHTRGYLTHYWLNSGSPFGKQRDQWH